MNMFKTFWNNPGQPVTRSKHYRKPGQKLQPYSGGNLFYLINYNYKVFVQGKKEADINTLVYTKESLVT